jgi:hypothetical protein
MKVMDRQHAVGESRARALFKHQKARPNSALSAAEFFAIKLGHRVVYVEHQRGAEHFQRQRTEHHCVGHGTNNHRVVAMRPVQT